MHTPLNVKIYSNRIMWGYYIFKNLIFYGNQSINYLILGKFPVDLAMYIFLLLVIYERKSRVYDTYKSLEDQNTIVNYIKIVNFYSCKRILPPHSTSFQTASWLLTFNLNESHLQTRKSTRWSFPMIAMNS